MVRTLHVVPVLIMLIAMSSLTGRVWAQAGPPLITDDPGTPGNGNWEINLSLGLEKTRDASEYETPLLDINYGLGERIQLKFEIPWIVVDEDGAPPRNGLGNSEVGVKWRFLDDAEFGLDMSMYPQLTFNNPTSSHERGIVEEGLELFLPVEIARPFGPVELGLEVGYAYIEKAEDEWAMGMAFAYTLSDSLEIVGEIHETATRDFGEDEAVFNLGFKYEFTEHLTLLTSAGRALWASTSDRTEVLAFVGLQFNFGKTHGN